MPETTETLDYTVNQDHKDTAEDEQWGDKLDITWSVNDHNIRSITAYRDWQNSTFESALRLPADLLNRITAYETKTLSEELQLVSPTGEYLEYVLGLYYYDEEYNINQQFDLGPDFCAAVRNLVTAGATAQALAAGAPPAVAQATGLGAGNAALGQCNAGPQSAAIDSIFHQELTSLAAFGQLTLNVSDQLRVTGKKRDDLQAVIALLKAEDFGVALQFTNYR